MPRTCIISTCKRAHMLTMRYGRHTCPSGKLAISFARRGGQTFAFRVVHGGERPSWRRRCGWSLSVRQGDQTCTLRVPRGQLGAAVAAGVCVRRLHRGQSWERRWRAPPWLTLTERSFARARRMPSGPEGSCKVVGDALLPSLGRVAGPATQVCNTKRPEE